MAISSSPGSRDAAFQWKKRREQQQGRLHAAKINGGAAAVEPRDGNRYTVQGRNGARYTVQVRAIDDMTCDCRAGYFERPCWHVAAVYLRRIAESAVPA